MILLQIFTIAAGLVAIAGFYRLLSGPTLTDRVIGLDLLFAVAIVFCFIAAWSSASMVFLDVAIGLALTGIVATLSWSRLIQVHSGKQDNNGDAS
jgi:multicomponent Na+:H+ antiporter subunit F